MTTQHPRTDTVAGLPPAGALPLQAALNSRLDPRLRRNIFNQLALTSQTQLTNPNTQTNRGNDYPGNDDPGQGSWYNRPCVACWTNEFDSARRPGSNATTRAKAGKTISNKRHDEERIPCTMNPTDKGCVPSGGSDSSKDQVSGALNLDRAKEVIRDLARAGEEISRSQVCNEIVEGICIGATLGVLGATKDPTAAGATFLTCTLTGQMVCPSPAQPPSR